MWNISWPVSKGMQAAECNLRILVHTALPVEALWHSLGEVSSVLSTCNRTADLPGESRTHPGGGSRGWVGRGGLTLLIPFHPQCGHVACAQLRPLISSSFSQEFCSAVALDTREVKQSQDCSNNDSLPVLSSPLRAWSLSSPAGAWALHCADWSLRPLGFSRLKPRDLHSAHSLRHWVGKKTQNSHH